MILLTFCEVSHLTIQSFVLNHGRILTIGLSAFTTVLDADGLIQFNERSQTVFVRAGVTG